MKVSYRREMKHNYLIIDPEELEWEGYESRMLAGNPVDGLLRFQVREMDCEVRFYYEITSRQPLSRVLEGKGLRAENIRSLLLGIFGALERMETYLLREERVLLEPEYLYVEPESFRTWLCVVPGLSRSFPDMLRELAEYLLDRVSREDKEGVVLAYGLYQETRRENYGMDDVMRLFYRTGAAGSDGWQEPMRQEPMRQAEPAEARQPDIKPVRRAGRKPEAAEDKNARRDSLWERGKRWLRTRICRSKAEPVQAPWEMLFYDAEEKPSVVEGEPCGGKPEFCTGIGKTPEPGTVLLADLTGDSGVRMLRSLDPGGEDIEIPYYPFIIGKQENLVDYCLREDTVSRLHLRLERGGESCRIQDLNSTNGTYVCGRLLENNEAAELHIGDEVQIARCRYRFE